MEWTQPVNSFLQLKPQNTSEFQEKFLQDGKQTELYNVSEQSPESPDINVMILARLKEQILKKESIQKFQTSVSQIKESVIVESLQEPKQMILNVKSSLCENNFQPMRLSRTLGVGLTSKERGFATYSKEQLKEISKQLWFPIETDLQDSVLSSSNGSLITTESNSWFLIKALEVKNPSFIKTCCPLSTSFPVEQMEQDDTKEKKPKEKPKSRIIVCCDFVVTKKIDGIVYGRECGKVLKDEEEYCHDHQDEDEEEYEQYWPYTCEAIIQKCGTGVEPERSRKGLQCGEFCSEGKKYCKRHEKTATKVKNPILRCVKVRARPNPEQRKELEIWFGGKRKTYNLAVEERMEDKFNGKIELKDKSNLQNSLANKLVTNCEEYLKAVPKDVRGDAVKEYFTGVSNAYNMYLQRVESEEWKKQNWINYKPKEIKLPVMKFQLKSEQQSIHIPARYTKVVTIESINGVGIGLYPKFFKKKPILLDRRSKRNRTLQKILKTNIQYDYRLLKTKTGKYYFCFPYAAEIKPTSSIKQASCDGGVRTFQTVYSPQGELEQYGSDCNSTIRNYQTRIQKLKNQYFNPGPLKHNKHLKLLRSKAQEKLKNLVTDLHYKTANSLCNKYETIVLPHYGTLSMISNKTSNIGSNTKRETLALSHAAFRRRLISKAELRACTILIPRNETGTTKTCGLCFVENPNVGSSKIFYCKCGLVAGRDVNAARNIFIRQLEF